jgi:hypothetical protein
VHFVYDNSGQNQKYEESIKTYAEKYMKSNPTKKRHFYTHLYAFANRIYLGSSFESNQRQRAQDIMVFLYNEATPSTNFFTFEEITTNILETFITKVFERGEGVSGKQYILSQRFVRGIDLFDCIRVEGDSLYEVTIQRGKKKVSIYVEKKFIRVIGENKCMYQKFDLKRRYLFDEGKNKYSAHLLANGHQESGLFRTSTRESSIKAYSYASIG